MRTRPAPSPAPDGNEARVGTAPYPSSPGARCRTWRHGRGDLDDGVLVFVRQREDPHRFQYSVAQGVGLRPVAGNVGDVALQKPKQLNQRRRRHPRHSARPPPPPKFFFCTRTGASVHE